ncbi:MAG: helix-turn-helix domain-containing protein [Nitrospirae bacterium]|nr:helix-turn-helix domain-containing protein [Nitrospirota bacterium]
MDDTFIQQLGKRIRLFRKQKKITQEMLGGRAGICPKYIGQIERAEKNPSLTVVCRIAQALELKLTDLIDGDSERIDNLCHMEKIIHLLKRQKPAKMRNIARALELLLDDKK